MNTNKFLVVWHGQSVKDGGEAASGKKGGKFHHEEINITDLKFWKTKSKGGDERLKSGAARIFIDLSGNSNMVPHLDSTKTESISLGSTVFKCYKYHGPEEWKLKLISHAQNQLHTPSHAGPQTVEVVETINIEQEPLIVEAEISKPKHEIYKIPDSTLDKGEARRTRNH